MRPMELLPALVNHRAPSEPAVIPTGWSMPEIYVVTNPAVVMRPMELSLLLVNHRPVGAGGDPIIREAGAGARAGEVGDHPAVVMRPMVLWKRLVNQRAPSGPAVIPVGSSMLRSV